MKIDNHIPLPQTGKQKKAKAISASARKLIDRYKAVYKKTYGVAALEPRYENGYVYVEGHAGVSLQIFKERVKRMEWRIAK